MYKNFICIVIALCFLSCHGYRTLERKGRPVSITPSPEMYGDSLNPVLSVLYPVVQSLKGDILESNELRPGTDNRVVISNPTLFIFKGSRLLIYPGEKIQIEGSIEQPVFKSINGNMQRDKELNFLQNFHKLQQYPNVPTYVIDPSIDTILKLEAAQRYRISLADVAAQRLFDSLAREENISGKFKKLSWSYTSQSYEGSLLWLYGLYRDSLKAHNLYFDKLNALRSRFNKLENEADLSYHVKRDLNELVRMLYPQNYIWSMNGEEGFKRSFDSVTQNFTGVARAYLLSRIMFRASMLGIPVAPAYEKQYRAYNANKNYRRIVRNVEKEMRKREKGVRLQPNHMVAAGDNRQVDLEEVIGQHKGKIIYIDLWTSWCQPCLQEIPHLNQLLQKYSGKEVVFISISSDKQSAAWREAIKKFQLQTEENYQMLHADKAAFYKKNDVKSIPRYLIIGKDGKMLYTEAPVPSDPGLITLVDSLLLVP